jgi:hypothetical protein
MRISADFNFERQVDVPRLGVHVRFNLFFPHRPPRNTEILFISMQDTRNIPMYLLSASDTNLQSNSPNLTHINTLLRTILAIRLNGFRDDRYGLLDADIFGG